VPLKRTALDRARFIWHDVRSFAGRVWEGAAEANVPFLASGLTFDALLAAIPFLLLVLAAAGYALTAEAGRAQVELHEYLQRFLPVPTVAGGPDPFAPVVRVLEEIVQKRGRLSLLGAPLFIWFSTRLFASLRSALCEVFDIDETRTFLMGKLHDTFLVLVATLLFVLNAALSEGVELVLRFNPVGMDFLRFFGAQLLAFAVVLLLFIIVFRYVPARRVRWDTALLAALICSLGFEVAKHLLGLYFQNVVHPENLVSNATVGGLLLFVLWTYYMSVVFLVGGQIAQVYELRRRQGQQRLVLH
jgi:membrane protein